MDKWITTKSGKRIKVQKKSNWISVKDKLPEPFATVLAYSINGRMYTVGYIDKLVGFMTRDTVTHWMPLPEPPKEKNNE